MGLGGYQRFILAASAAALAGLVAGCGNWDPDLEPPQVKQIACRPVGAAPSTAARVYVLDTGARTATWVNGDGDSNGQLVVEDRLYHFTFEKAAVQVNRFDGQMIEEVGQGPFFGTGPVPKGNRRRAWTCAAQMKGPKF
jgi:hypothetical protein